MIGYKEDTLVTILKYYPEYERVERENVKISEVKDTDYVGFLYLPSQSLIFLKANISSGNYKGQLHKLTDGEDKEIITYCEGQKLLCCQFEENVELPIVDERKLEEFKEEDSLSTMTGLSYMVDYEKNKTIEEYVRYYEDPSMSRYRYQKREIMDEQLFDYNGTIYNFITPIEYALVMNNFQIGTTLHK